MTQPRKAIPRGEGLSHPEPRCGSIATSEAGVNGFIKDVRVCLRNWTMAQGIFAALVLWKVFWGIFFQIDKLITTPLTPLGVPEFIDTYKYDSKRRLPEFIARSSKRIVLRATRGWGGKGGS